jgi:hypothetical protein
MILGMRAMHLQKKTEEKAPKQGKKLIADRAMGAL